MHGDQFIPIPEKNDSFELVLLINSSHVTNLNHEREFLECRLSEYQTESLRIRFELNREIFIDTQLKFHELKIPVEKNPNKQHMLVRYVLKHGSWFELVQAGP